jgi:hypothetical protein
MPHSNAPAELMRLVLGFQASQAIHVAVRLGIADLLKEGPRNAQELGPQVEADAGALYRLLRTLAALGVFYEDDQKKFTLTPMGECLRSDAETPIGPMADYIGRPHHWSAWGSLLNSVKTGQSAFKHLHGMTSWQYFQENPEVGEVFDRAMSGNSRSDATAIVTAYDFSPFRKIIDIAGGQGVLLAGILTAHQGARGTLFDRPDVIARASAFDEAGVSDRVNVVGGNFFEAVPAGGDAYLLKLILHDWDDEGSLAILGMIRSAIEPYGKLIVFERVVEPPNEGAATKLSDLNMMVSPGGIERTAQEFADIFHATGFRLRRIIATMSRLSVIEASPV